MDALRTKARALLESSAVKVVIGYAAGANPQRGRPVFVRQPDQTALLIFDAHCKANLAVYLTKPEVKALGKAAVIARPAALRTLLQYAAENQFADESVVALAVSDMGEVKELPNFTAMEEYAAALPRGLTAEQQPEIDKIATLSREERWAFWREEFSHCLKCYACRAACPLCYCSRCIVDNNQPQWVPVPSDDFGNLEWHIVRAMHLAGRCINCNSCYEACPEGIRLDLLNHVLAQEAHDQFGAEAGYSRRREYALSVYKAEDKEDFIR